MCELPRSFKTLRV